MSRTISHYRIVQEIGHFLAFVREALDGYDRYLRPVR
jgi:hypothetical protein